MKVFLGGAADQSQWRSLLISELNTDYTDPTEARKAKTEFILANEQEIQDSSICLYILTSSTIEEHLHEAVEQSERYPDKTICGYFQEEGTELPFETIHSARESITSNGSVWLDSLEEVLTYLNGEKPSGESGEELQEINDVFISYGRRHSKAFAEKLCTQLQQNGFKVWFDQNNIPLAVDFQQEIDEGIRKAHNFCFIISPHSVKSAYCLKEIVQAIRFKKKIIPVFHVDPEDAYEYMHPIIQKLNWLYADGEEKFNGFFTSLVSVLQEDKQLVEYHTQLLDLAWEWKRHKEHPSMLLYGEDRLAAEGWMNRLLNGNFPFTPSGMHCEYITASRKEALVGKTDTFLIAAKGHQKAGERIAESLLGKGVTVSNSEMMDEDEIVGNIVRADNMLIVAGKDQYADPEIERILKFSDEYQKRVIWLSTTTGISDFVNQARGIFGVQVTAFNKEEDDKQVLQLRDILNILEKEKDYHAYHTKLLAQAYDWQQHKKTDSFLLRDKELEVAESWLKIARLRNIFQPTPLQVGLIEMSQEMTAHLFSEVYLGYAPKDHDLAAKLNQSLREHQKVTWMDEQDIPIRDTPTEGLKEALNVLILLTDGIAHIYQDEIAYAETNKKRIIPLLMNGFSGNELPELCQAYQQNAVDFRQDFNTGLIELLRKLDTDKEYLNSHAHWLRKATEWEQHGMSTEKLLTSTEVVLAEEWLMKSVAEGKQPLPTELQHSLVEESKTAIENKRLKEIREKSRLKRLIIALAGILIISIGLGVVSFHERERAESNALKAMVALGKASESEKRALVEKENAKKSEKAAKEAEKEAVKQSRLASAQRKIAIDNALIAKENEQKAKENERRALDSEQKAKDNERKAKEERDKADALYKETMALRSADNATTYFEYFDLNKTRSNGEIQETIQHYDTLLKYKPEEVLGNQTVYQALLNCYNQLKPKHFKVIEQLKNAYVLANEHDGQNLLVGDSRAIYRLGINTFQVIGLKERLVAQSEGLTYIHPSYMRKLAMVQPNSETEFSIIQMPIPELNPIYFWAFEPETNHYFSINRDNHIYKVRWNEVPVTPFRAHPNGGRYLSMALSTQEGLLAAGDDRGRIELLELNGNVTGTLIDTGNHRITAIRIVGSRYLLAGTDNGTVMLWDYLNQKLLSSHDLKSGSISSLTLSTDNSVLLAGAGDRVFIWRLGQNMTFSRDHKQLLFPREVLLNNTEFFGGDKVITTGQKGTYIWMASTHALRNELEKLLAKNEIVSDDQSN
ncbi:TIR domain-containing protein [Limibacter armeniacum]|uniref:toll/interleukin-1 receptor domain-containing protein n=1 Tax=Limibacter armeniacum TaxID=466084 RepID=UPI002FE6A460